MSHTESTDRPPRWLSPAEMRAWRGWVEASTRVRDRIGRDLKEDSDLSWDDYEVLVRLSEADCRRIRMSDLADRAMNSPSRMSQRIDRMAERGLVERVRCSEDGRGWFAELTPEGLRVLEAAAPPHVESVRRHLFDHLSEADIEVLADLMPQLADLCRLDQPAGARTGETASG